MHGGDRKLGLWSVIGLTVVGYLYAALYLLFAILFPMQVWNGMADFASYFSGAYAIMFTIIQICAFSISLLMFLFGAVVYQAAPQGKKAIGLAGFGATAVFFTFSCFHYVVQWTSVRAGLHSGNLAGLDMFVMSNFDSPLSVVNVIGWTLLLGIASLCFTASFPGGGRMKAIRAGFLMNGLACIFTFVLYTLGIKIAMLGWTGALTVTWYVYPMLIPVFKNGFVGSGN